MYSLILFYRWDGKMFDNQVHNPKNKEDYGALTANVDIEKIHSVMKTLAHD